MLEEEKERALVKDARNNRGAVSFTKGIIIHEVQTQYCNLLVYLLGHQIRYDLSHKVMVLS